jgi:biopolymer transport protein ExbD
LTVDQELFVMTCTEVAQHLVALQVDPAVHARLEELAEKCTEAQISADEHIEYETYVQALEFIAVLQAQARNLLTNSRV